MIIYVLELYQLEEQPPIKNVWLSKMYKEKPTLTQILTNLIPNHPEVAEDIIQSIGNSNESHQMMTNNLFDVPAGELRLRLYKETITMN